MKKRKGQLVKTELEVKTFREKLIEIQKRITPEVVKNLNKVLDKSQGKQTNLHIMLMAFSSLINMKHVTSMNDVRADIKDHSHLTEKMINAIATHFQTNSEVIER